MIGIQHHPMITTPKSKAEMTRRAHPVIDSHGSLSEPEWVRDLLDEQPHLCSCSEQESCQEDYSSNDEPWKDLYSSSDETVDFSVTSHFTSLKESSKEEEEKEPIWNEDFLAQSSHLIKSKNSKSLQNSRLKNILRTQTPCYLLQVAHGSNEGIVFNARSFTKTKIKLPFKIPQGCAVVQTTITLLVSGGGETAASRKTLMGISIKAKVRYEGSSKYEFRYHSIAQSHKTLLTLGGFSPKGAISTATERYFLDRRIWKITPHMVIARIKPGNSFVGYYVYCFAGYMRNFKSGIEGIQRLDSRDMKQWNLIVIRNRIVGMNGLMGLNVIRVNKDRVALFGGQILPKQSIALLSPEIMESGEFQKNEVHNYIEFSKSKSYAFALQDKIDLSVGCVALSILSVVKERKLFFLDGDKVKAHFGNKWYSLPI